MNTTPTNQRVTKGQKTKQDILYKANELFSENGFDATGVDQIVGELKLTSGVFYNYFSSKSDLLKQVVDLKIARATEFLLVAREKESATQWVERILKLYLSTEHRDAIDQSCPITTLSQELIKLNVDQSMGLARYTQEFLDILNRRLLMISAKNTGKASSIMGLCIGALILARLEIDKNKSKKILDEALVSAMGMVEQRGAYVGKSA